MSSFTYFFVEITESSSLKQRIDFVESELNTRPVKILKPALKRCVRCQDIEEKNPHG